jgi:hypothetical protein
MHPLQFELLVLLESFVQDFIRTDWSQSWIFAISYRGMSNKISARTDLENILLT